MPFYGSPLIQDFFRVFAQNRAEPMCPPSHKTDRSAFATDRQKFPNSRVSWSLGYVQRSGFHRPLIFSLVDLSKGPYRVAVQSIRDTHDPEPAKPVLQRDRI